MRMPGRNGVVIVVLTLIFVLCLTKVFFEEIREGDRVDYRITTEHPSADWRSTLINVNTAGVSELTQLPGIGEELAERIIRYREENGDFREAEDMLAVSGIGERRLEDMRAGIIFSEEERYEDTGRG